MPRTARTKKPQPTLTAKNPQAAADDQTRTKGGPPGRKANGQFARGNPGGPGNPHARFSAGMLTIARQTMTPEKIAAVFESIYVKALSGDMTAAKLILHYTIGKPGDAPHPDHLERDEWDLYQKNAMTFAEMQQALGGLPCSLGNEIVGAALPAMTEARAKELATQLRGEKPGTKGQRKDKGRRRKEEPNGTRRVPASKRTQDQAATAVDPWDVDTVPPLTNGSADGKTSSGISHSQVAKNQSPTASRQPLTTKSSPATKNHSPAAKSAPLTNRVSNGPANANKRRKLVAKQWLQPIIKKVTGAQPKAKKRQPA